MQKLAMWIVTFCVVLFTLSYYFHPADLKRSFVSSVRPQKATAKVAKAAPRNSVSPQPVMLGMFIVSLHDFDIPGDSFGADFWLWSNTLPHKSRPLDTLELRNARSFTGKSSTREEKDGVIWSQRHIRGVFRHGWDTRNFPFDRHVLHIELEESISNSGVVLYTADLANSGLAHDAQSKGWNVTDVKFLVTQISNDTSFGDPELSRGAKYSRFTATIAVKRQSTMAFWKLHMGVYVAFAISMLSFLMRPEQATIFSGRMGLLVGALFAVVINSRAADAVLGRSDILTLADKVHIATMIFIFCAALTAVFSRRSVERHDIEHSRDMDRKMVVVFVLNYIAVNVCLILLAAQEG